ncbi:N-acetylmuramic acid 6-phosphate phosphatase [Nymphon striatum]|nr:N-acetylmuramic acid 6-phosphate phosphatase [Nymphon striatum]
MAELDNSSKISSVLFDLDGTLLDTAPDMTNALNLLLAEEDKAPLTTEFCRDFVSHGSVAMVTLGFGEQQDPDEFERRRLRFLHLYERNLCLDTKLFEGMDEVLLFLEENYIRWGIVTNKPAFLTDPLLEELKLSQRACSVISGDTIPERKPNPEPLYPGSKSMRQLSDRMHLSPLSLAGVFGTVVSLSMALIGAAGLLNSPEGVKEMGTIISGMSSALSSTITAIVCFFIFAYFYLRLNDARIQMLTHIEDMTTMYLIPSVSHTEEGMIHKVAELTKSLNLAAEKLLMVEDRFIHAGDRLNQAVSDLHGQVNTASLDDIKDLIRKGFHLSEPEYQTEALTDQSRASTSINAQEIASNLADNRQTQNKTLAARLSTLEKQLVTLNDKYEVEKASLADTKQKLSSTTQDLTAKVGLLTSIENQLKALNTKYETEKANFANKTLTQKEKIASSEKLIKANQASIAALKSDLENTQKEKESLAALNTSQKEKIAESEKLLKTNATSISTLKSDLASTEEAKQALAEENASQQEQIKIAQNQEKTLTAKLLDTEKVVASLEKAKQSSVDEITQLKTAAASSVVVLESLQSDRGKLDEKYNLLTSDLEKSKKTLEQERLTSKNLQQQLLALQESLKQQQESANDKNSAEQTLAQKLDEKSKEILKLTSSVEESQKLLKDKEQQIASLKESQEAGNSQLRSLQGEYDSLDSKYQKLLRPARSSKGKYIA